MFKNKTLLITGGTGSFGNAVLERFAQSDLKEIRIFSRDEKKQDDMRKKYRSSKIKFFLGDVRDPNSVNDVVSGVNFIFHAAALKQVPSCEFFPLQAVETNVMGTRNVIDSAVKNNVEKIICLSTDKAVYPINAMGISKAMMEKVAIAKSRNSIGKQSTKICITRYGNVMASRGSVIPLFINQIKNNKPLTITNKDMTRFMMTLDDAVNLVLFAFENGESGDLFVQKSPAATIETLGDALLSIYDSNVGIKDIGTRHGEKDHEVLCSREEMFKAIDLGDYYKVVPDDRDLNYSLFENKGMDPKDATEYSSANTKRLDREGMIELLSKIDLNSLET
jgi:UDP-N-acetylglucosamine 4,6-dehydratase/5-epimerase